LYFIGAQDGPLATRVAGDGGSDVARHAVDAATSPAGAATPASTVGTLPPEASARAFTASVTAVELASAYTHDRAAADRLYRGKALLLTGMVAGVGRDGAALTLAANDYPPVRVQGLAAAAVAALRPEQQVTLACTGAGATGNAAEVSDCSMQ
ncbi:MAG TPA: hypothetical protein VFE72_13070, partial [Lysobacter sp.]|nr:hypothetical protein [Lysobacter sp.]